jgi:uncharacterized protein (TIGR03083 family)
MADVEVTALEQTWDGIFHVLDGLGDDDWSKPTPCTDWDVHDLVAHVAGIESMFQGLPQPEPPPGWAPPSTGDRFAFTAAGVAARRSWSRAQLLDEAHAAAEAQIGRLRDLDDEGWAAPANGPLGPTTVEGLAAIRVFDLFVHLLDLRAAIGAPLDAEATPDALAVSLQRVWDATAWGAAKKAQLPDGTRVGLDVRGPGGRACDVVVSGGRGAVTEPDAGTIDRVDATSAAWLLQVAGRAGLVDDAGGVKASGDAAAAFAERFRLFQ